MQFMYVLSVTMPVLKLLPCVYIIIAKVSIFDSKIFELRLQEVLEGKE